MEDVLPFLENVLRGTGIPKARMMEVARHYERFGGVSPLNDQNRELMSALEDELKAEGIDLPVYWGNRNWYPFLSDTMQRMKEDGIERVLAFVTSAYSSYSGCRQYLEDLGRARSKAGEGAPHVEKLRLFFNHPSFIEANAARVREALAQFPQGQTLDRLVFSAHSLPIDMTRRCDYEIQIWETCRLVADSVGVGNWDLAYQSRSGPPHQPWLEPDICDHLEGLGRGGNKNVIVSPIGFLSDHLEVVYDLDKQAQAVCREAGMVMVRARTVGIHPSFVRMVRELVEERLSGTAERPFLGGLGPSPDDCPDDCCLASG